MKTISLILSMMLTSIYILVPHQEALQMGLSQSSLIENPWDARIHYIFLHNNLTHLLINLYCLLSLSFLAGARVWQFIVSILVAWTIPSALVASIPTLGISAVNFALTGLVIMKSDKWRWLMCANLLMIFLTLAIPGVAAGAHLYAFFVGALIGFILKPQFQ